MFECRLGEIRDLCRKPWITLEEFLDGDELSYSMSFGAAGAALASELYAAWSDQVCEGIAAIDTAGVIDGPGVAWADLERSEKGRFRALDLAIWLAPGRDAWLRRMVAARCAETGADPAAALAALERPWCYDGDRHGGWLGCSLEPEDWRVPWRGERVALRCAGGAS